MHLPSDAEHHAHDAPLAPSAPPAPSGPPAPSAPSASERAQMATRLPLRILVAEDNPVNVKLIRIVLGGLGYQPDVVGNGREVTAALRRQRYDVVLMDLCMPEMDGIEATRQIVREWPASLRPRIIALTAGVTPCEREACLEAGVDELLIKPAVRAQLLEVLERCRPPENDTVEPAARKEINP
jgi:CheY-like chemotaxis protein